MEGKKRSIAELAHISTISEEEKNKAYADAQKVYSDLNGEEEAYDSEREVADGYDTEGENAGEADTAASYPGKKEKPRMEHTEPSYTCTAKPEARDMFDFMMYHTYHNPAGIFSVVIGLGAIVALILNIINKGETIMTVLLAVIVVMFLANSPVTIWYRAKKQAEAISDSANTITYTFSSAGLDMKRGNDYAAYEWSHVEKVVEVKNCYYFYLSKNSAFVIPKEDFGGSDAGFKNIIRNAGIKKCVLMKEDA